jgi:hypothetical protein
MRKGNPHKKQTFEDKFDRNYACWVKNNRKAWRFWKKRNIKRYRQIEKKEIQDELNDSNNFNS